MARFACGNSFKLALGISFRFTNGIQIPNHIILEKNHRKRSGLFLNLKPTFSTMLMAIIMITLQSHFKYSIATPPHDSSEFMIYSIHSPVSPSYSFFFGTCSKYFEVPSSFQTHHFPIPFPCS